MKRVKKYIHGLLTYFGSKIFTTKRNFLHGCAYKNTRSLFKYQLDFFFYVWCRKVISYSCICGLLFSLIEIDMLQCNVKRTVLLFEIFCKYVIQAIGMSVMLCDLVTIEKIMRYQLCEYQLPGSFSITNITFDLSFRNKETVDKLRRQIKDVRGIITKKLRDDN